MANIKLYTNISGATVGNKLIAVWRRPGQSEGGRQVFDIDTPSFPLAFVIENLQPYVYEVQLYESTNGSSLDIPLFEIPATIDASEMAAEESYKIFHYTVGAGAPSPGPDSQTLVDDRLNGAKKEEVNVHLTGIGDLHPDQFDLLDGGGVTLLSDGLTFGSAGNFLNVQWHPSKTVSAVPPAVTGEPWRPVSTSGQTFNQDYYNINNVGEFGGVVAKTYFDSFASIPDGTTSIFSTFGNTSRYWSLIFNANTIFFAATGRAMPAIHLGQNERIVIGWRSGAGRILDYQGDYKWVGKKIGADRPLVNTLLANAMPDRNSTSDYAGQAQLIEDVPRLIDELPSHMKVTFPAWDTYQDIPLHKQLDNTGAIKMYRYYPNRGKFAVDTTHIILPAVAGQVEKFITDTTSEGRLSGGPGSIEPNRLLEHGHRPMEGQGGSQTNGILTRGFAGRDTKRIYVPYPELIEDAGVEKASVDNFGVYQYICI